MSAALASPFLADGGGLWLDGCCGLGQRLMAVTPQDRFERQPLSDAQAGLTLVSDGRVDNRPELLDELGLAGAGAGAEEIPDGALILQAYRRWGRECLQRLVGVFAFVIWDAGQRELFAARSPIRAPALVYYASASRFAFASMPRGLHALPGIARRLNERKLAQHLTLTSIEPQATFYQDVLRLPTGHWLAVSPQGLATGAFWQPDLSKTLDFASDDECLQALGGLLERVVADALRGQTPAGMLLSGGLDSTAVAAQAAGLLAGRGERLAGFTAAPRPGFAGAVTAGRVADESGLAESVARRYPNLDLKIVRTPGGFFMDDLERLFPYLEMPFRNTSNRVWWEAIYREASQGGLRTALDGTQGNLTLTWQGAGLLAELLRGGRWRQAWQQAGASGPDTTGAGRLGKVFRQGLLPWLPDDAWWTLKRLSQPGRSGPPTWLARTPLNPAFAAELRLAEEYTERDAALRQRHPADTRSLRWQALGLQDSGMYLSAYQALYGVYGNSPLADVRLAEFCLALPESQYCWNGETRRLARRAMAGLLPQEVLDNRQRGLQAADWYERLHAARPRLADELERLERSPLAQRVLDLPRLQRLFAAMPPPDEPDFERLIAYRAIFEPGLMMGGYLRWFEGG